MSMSHDMFGRAAKEDMRQPSAAMGRSHDEIHFVITGIIADRLGRQPELDYTFHDNVL